MYEARKQFDESLRKDKFEDLFMERRKKILGMMASPNSKYSTEARNAEDMVEEVPEIFRHKQDYLTILAKFEKYAKDFDDSKTEEQYTIILRNLNREISEYVTHSQQEQVTYALNAFYNSGLPRYFLQFLKPGYRGNKDHVRYSLQALSNASLGMLVQSEILISLGVLDLCAELFVDQKNPISTNFGMLMWLLCNAVGKHIQVRDLVLQHPTLLDNLVHCWDNRSVSLDDSKLLIWFCSNLIRSKTPEYGVGFRFAKRAAGIFLKYHPEPEVYEEGICTFDYWLSGTDEPIQRARDLMGWNVWRNVRENWGGGNARTVRQSLRMLGSLSSTNQDDLLAALFDLELCESLLKNATHHASAIATDSMWVVSNLLASGAMVQSKISSAGVIKVCQYHLQSSYSTLKVESLKLLNNFITTSNAARFELILNSTPDVCLV